MTKTIKALIYFMLSVLTFNIFTTFALAEEITTNIKLNKNAGLIVGIDTGKSIDIVQKKDINITFTENGNLDVKVNDDQLALRDDYVLLRDSINTCKTEINNKIAKHLVMDKREAYNNFFKCLKKEYNKGDENNISNPNYTMGVLIILIIIMYCSIFMFRKNKK